VTNRLQEELGIIIISFTPIGAVVGGGAARVTLVEISQNVTTPFTTTCNL